MDEPDPAVELRVPDEALFDAGHADQDRAELAAVVAVAELRANDRLTWSANLRQVPGHLGANRYRGVNLFWPETLLPAFRVPIKWRLLNGP